MGSNESDTRIREDFGTAAGRLGGIAREILMTLRFATAKVSIINGVGKVSTDSKSSIEMRS